MEDGSLTKTDSSARGRSSERSLVWIALLVTTLTYLGTIRFDFVYDDITLILLNPFVRSWRFASQYFTSSLWRALYPTDPPNFYRPLVALWLRCMYSVFGPRPLGWHLIALGLYVMTGWLVYLVAKELTGEIAVAWLAALIFGLHPIHHEVVAWVTGASESLVTIPFLAAFLAYAQSRKVSRVAWRITSCSLYGVALLCKETAIVLPAIVFVYEWVVSNAFEGSKQPGLADRLGKATISAVLYAPVALAYLIVRHRILMGMGHALAPVTVSMWLLTIPSILFAYVTHWFYPVRLSEFYDVLYRSRVDFMHVVLPAVILIVAGAALWFFRKRLDEKAVGLAVAWIVIPLLPALDTFVFNPGDLVQDRYFYIPSVGAAVLTALIIFRAMRTRTGPFGLPRHVIVAGLALSVVLALIGTRETSFWAHNYTLFSRGHQIAPSSSKAAMNLGTEMINGGDVDGAQALFEAGYRRNPYDSMYAIRMGWVQYFKKRYGPAEKYVRQGIALDPYAPDSYFYLGQILLRENHLPEARDSMRRAVELNPYSAQYHAAYGITLQVTGDCAAARQQFATALELSPGYPIPELLQALRCSNATLSTQPTATKPGSR